MPTQKVALITGANKGIGFEVARQLIKKGFRVVITARDRKKGAMAVEKLSSTGGNVTLLTMDVSDRKSVERAATDFGKLEQKLDVLVNNAGIYPDNNVPITETKEQIFLDTYRTNTLGPVLATQLFLPYLLKAAPARVVNVSSGAGAFSSMPTFSPAYSISKTALNGATAVWAAVLAEKKIAVNAVCPGWVRTEMGGAEAPRSVEEGADTIAWMASDAPLTITGKFLRDRQVIPW